MMEPWLVRIQDYNRRITSHNPAQITKGIEWFMELQRSEKQQLQERLDPGVQMISLGHVGFSLLLFIHCTVTIWSQDPPT